MPRMLCGAALCLAIAAAPALGQDLSSYRDVRFGADLASVAARAGIAPDAAKTLHSRPALIQELTWRPRPLGPSARAEAADEIVFTFCNGRLFRVAVAYGRYETEGLTAGDIIEAVAAAYGAPEKPAPPVIAAPEKFGEQEDVIARWQDAEYRFDLTRRSYGPTFQLTGVAKSLEAPAEAAIREARRLDNLEAPQRDAAQNASEQAAKVAGLEKTRLENKAKFRP